LLVYTFQKYINLKKIKNFSLVFLFLFLFSPMAYLYVSIFQTDKRTDYPGKEIANKIQKKWDSNFTNNIGIIIGDEWHGGNLSYHLSSKPKWYSYSAAFANRSLEDFIKLIGDNGLIIINGKCSDIHISFIIEKNKICMSGNK